MTSAMPVQSSTKVMGSNPYLPFRPQFKINVSYINTHLNESMLNLLYFLID